MTLFIGTVASILAVVVAFFAWRRAVSGRRKLIWTVVDDIELLNPAAPSLPLVQLSVRGNDLENPALSRIRLWNGGTEPILAEQIRNLRIQVTEGGLGTAWVSAVTNIENGVQVGDDGDVTFQYLNRGDGAELMVAYTKHGASRPKLAGGLVGAEMKRAFSGGEVKMLPSTVASWMGGLAILLGAVWPGIVVLQLMESETPGAADLQHELAELAVNPFTLFALGALLLMWGIGFTTSIAARFEREAEPSARELIGTEESQ